MHLSSSDLKSDDDTGGPKFRWCVMPGVRLSPGGASGNESQWRLSPGARLSPYGYKDLEYDNKIYPSHMAKRAAIRRSERKRTAIRNRIDDDRTKCLPITARLGLPITARYDIPIGNTNIEYNHPEIYTTVTEPFKYYEHYYDSDDIT